VAVHRGRARRLVDQVELELGPDRRLASAEALAREQLPERRDGRTQTRVKTPELGFRELAAVDLETHGGR